MADHAQLHFVSGAKLAVQGTVADVQGLLTSERGGHVMFKDHQERDVLVNPDHVTHVTDAPGRGVGGFH